VILRSIAVQGWRCFANRVSIGPFAEGLNVLHAPNATGKSTLFEALLRGLLDGHRVSGKDVESLRPWGRDLAPTVTVEFAHAGSEYRITKRFLDRPSAELERREDGRFVRVAEGEAADDRVRELFTRNRPGRGLARPENSGLVQVLWAPQGNLAVSKLSGDLVTDIRTALGAQLAGPGSEPLEQGIEAAYLRFYTATGQLKRGKDAAPAVRLRDDLEPARAALTAAREHQQLFEETARRVEDLRARRLQARRDAEAFTKALGNARKRVDAYRDLVSEKAQRTERVHTAEARHGELKQRIEAIRTVEDDLATARRELERLRSELPSRIREVEEREKEVQRTRMALEDIRKTRDAVEAAGQRATVARRYLDESRHAEALGERLRRIEEASAALVRCKRERSGVVAPDARTMRAIRKAIRDRDDAQVRLEAALITVEIVPERAGRLVVIAGEDTGERALAAAVAAQVQGSPEVVVDLVGFGRLRARGPAGSIAEIRAERDTAVQKLGALTETFGTTDIEALEALSDRAARLTEKVAAAQTHLDTLLDGEAGEAIEAQRAASTAALSQIAADHPEWRDSRPDAEALRAAADAHKRAFLEAIDRAEAERDKAQTALNAVAQQRAVAAVRLEETERQEKALVTRLAELTGDGKQDAERQSDLKRIALSWEASRASLEEIEGKLAEFGDDPSGAVARLEKQLQSADEANTKALEQEKSEEGRLTQLSAEGPYTALARAEEDVARLERAIAEEDLRLAAIRLLRDTVQQCRNAALAAVAGPVELAATRTLQRIAGTRLGPVRLSDSFVPAEVTPGVSATPVPIDSMSGGEREQIYLGTRLALADVLARGERQLVVLDDVLVATDAGRLARVMAILEEAAIRLQVLILTCHPERYLGLTGATLFDLEALVRNS